MIAVFGRRHVYHAVITADAMAVSVKKRTPAEVGMLKNIRLYAAIVLKIVLGEACLDFHGRGHDRLLRFPLS